MNLKNVVRERLELSTSALSARRYPTELTDQLMLGYNFTTYVLTISTLIYRSKKKRKKKWSVRGSNSRPPHYHHGALPTELTDQLTLGYNITTYVLTILTLIYRITKNE